MARWRMKPKGRSKMGNVPTTVGGIRFDSKLEADLYRELRLLSDLGEIRHFLRQVPIHLAQGKTMRVDFAVQCEGRELVWLDAKGKATSEWLTKQAWARDKFGIEVHEVTRESLNSGEWRKWLI